MIEKIGLNPSQFVFEPVPSRFDVLPSATRLTFRGTEYAFLIDRRHRRDFHYVLYCPGLHNYEAEANPGTDWHLVKAYFKEWLENLLREIGEPDRWQSLAVELAGTTVGFEPRSDGDTFFTVKEYDQLVGRLDTASQRLDETGLSEEEIEVIRVKFNHMKDMGRKLNRSDWESLFVGTIVSSMTQLGVNPEAAQQVWNILKEVFGNLLLG